MPKHVHRPPATLHVFSYSSVVFSFLNSHSQPVFVFLHVAEVFCPCIFANTKTMTNAITPIIAMMMTTIFLFMYIRLEDRFIYYIELYAGYYLVSKSGCVHSWANFFVYK